MGIFKRNFSAPVAPFASHVAPDGDGGGAKPLDLPDPQQPAAAGRARKSAAKLAAEGGVAKNPIVAAAFASLLQEEKSLEGSKGSSGTVSDIDDRIINAGTDCLAGARLHDMCQGPHTALNGVQSLACRLLRAAGYSVLSVPYHEFSTADKLLKRVEYLQKAFKAIVSEKP
ncbi:cell cycle progression [Culex quinquefasciatus]|uniref:Cell cycle progression n=1 Tax=Culex quinquefasciatus TaxID=7176 RepID=B0W8Q0_CULQU|nr:cell cycle progression [Culex quinquefasciatus]|eukprot:XP_001845084.1 cell cycle progression [Culex quinquefasciatus]